MATNIRKTTNGRMICSNEIPAALMASNSNRSPRLPKVISEASRIASGNAMGTIVTAA